ncbi:hypothetical protein FRC11_007073, partial [Ceratobasidium sp. 423]
MCRRDTEDLDRGVASDVRSSEELLRAFSAVPPVSGRRESFESHIRRCKRINPTAKVRLAQERSRFTTLSSAWPVNSAQGGPDSQALVHPVCTPTRPPPSKERQARFESDLCKLWVANEWAWRAIDEPETQRFFRKWFPTVALPDRQKLSSSLLRKELDAANSLMHNAISGRLATGMSCGWKNTKYNSLMASMLSVDYKTYTVKVHDVSAEHKTIDDHLSLVLGDIDYAERTHKAQVIAWVSDASSDSRAMRVRLHRLRPHILVFDSWIDQINLVVSVSDILSQSSHLVDTADTAINIIRWILRHPGLLGRLHHEQSQGGKPPSLTLPTHARWTSHYLSFRSLLSISRSLRSLAASDTEAFRVDAGSSPEQKEEAELFLRNIQDPNFWEQLAELDRYLEPLAIAANVSPTSATRLDHILVELGRLYHVFSHPKSNPEIREVALASLERCWSKSDQDPYILAVFLNPFIRGRLFSRVNPLLNRWAIYGAVKRVFRRVFRKEHDLELYEAFLDYYDFRNEFNPDRWGCREQQVQTEREGNPLNLVQVWSSLLAPQASNSGRSQLAHLAIHILSIIANSSSYEHRGHIHTKDRGRQKALDAQVVRMSLKRKHAAEGNQSRLKRRLGDSTSATHVERDQTDDFGEVDLDEDSTIPSLRALATQLRQDVFDDEGLL